MQFHLHDLVVSHRLLKSFAFLMPFSPYRGIVFWMLNKSVKSILDVGCREGAAMQSINLRRLHIWRLGVDLDLESLRRCKKSSIYDDIILCDARWLPLSSKCLDCVLCIEFIEHLKKKDAIRFLEDIEKIARKQTIITTPVGYIKEPPSYSPLLQHVSQWHPGEFRSKEYNVKGMIGPSFLPMVLAYWLSHIFCLTYFWPELSHEMICVKHLDNLL